jgi:peptide/nickel transport system substrate-binding protein
LAIQKNDRIGHVRTVILLLAVWWGMAWPIPYVQRTLAADKGPAPVYHEAPQLRQQVDAGKLPAVDERLPHSPLLVQPFERIGRYGGTWLRGIRRTRDHASFIRTIGYENLMRWDPLWINAIPNIAERYEVNADATRYTFYLREGMRWSDGEPFTASDIVFWYEDVLLNRDLTPSIPAWLTSGGKPVVVEKRDEKTVVFSFAVPNGLFLMNLAAPWGGEPTEYPRHYLQQFHPRYNPDGIVALVSKAGLKGWPALFRRQAGKEVDHPSRWQNPALPRLHAWTLTTAYAPEADRIVAERNPYFWKIDPAGNQLPYIDRVIYTMFSERSQLEEMVRQGKINMQTRHIPQQDIRAMVHEQTFSLISSFSNTAVISLNLTHRDPVLREIFQNKNFRIGLSHAINRQEIMAKVFNEEGEPYQAAPKPESPFYHERLAHQYTAYDVSLANAYLDKAGCARRDDAGYRLRPDGRRIAIALDVIDFLSMLEVARWIPGYWNKVGIETRLNIMEREDMYRRKSANQHDAVVWVGDGGLAVLLEPRWYFPSSPIESNYAIPWARWYRDRDDPRGEQPPEAARRQMRLYDEILTTADQKKQYDTMTAILDIAADQFYVIGISTPPLRYGILKTGFHNVPTFIPHSWTYPHPAPTNPCQYFMDRQ